MTMWKSEAFDENIVGYLKKTGSFFFFGPETRSKVRQLQHKDRRGCLGVNTESTILLDLWSLVLTDALKGLKKNDPREWAPRCGINFNSFFNKESLGITEFQKVVKGFTEFESLLYGASPERHRDHIAHSFRVWILGQKLLREALGGCLHIDTGTSPRPDLKIGPIEWECMWALTALCHDIGYPFSKVDMINEKATDTLQKQGLRSLGSLRFSFSAEMEPFYQAVMCLMASNVVHVKVGDKDGFLTHVQNKYYLKFLNSCDQLKHGVIGSLLMAKSLVYFLESDLCLDSRRPLTQEDARQFLIRREILRAVASHTCPEIYHLKFNTLSFLLFMVDELQCWGRPTLEELQTGYVDFARDSVTIKEFKCDKIDIAIKSTAPWDSSRENVAKSVLSGINRRLRLAVDAKDYKGLFLRFRVSGKNGKGRELILRGGRINHRSIG